MFHVFTFHELRRKEMRIREMRWIACMGVSAALLAHCAEEDRSNPGKLQPEPATLHCLAVRWPILGDANGNATVEVAYRKIGESDWKQGFPLLRTLQEASAEQQHH